MTQPPSYSNEILTSAHKFSRRNRELLLVGTKCGCFRCQRIYHPGEIDEWLTEVGLIEGSATEVAHYQKVTALCPNCGIDSVLPECDKYPLTPDFLKAMHEYWF